MDDTPSPNDKLDPVLQVLLETALKDARQQMVEKGELQPVAWIHGGEGTLAAVDMRAATQRDKDMAAFMVRELVKLHDADAVVLLSEAWTLPQHLAKNSQALLAEYGSIGQIPGRIEIVFIKIETRTGLGCMAQAEILRKGRAIALATPTITDITGHRGEGRYSNFFEETP